MRTALIYARLFGTGLVLILKNKQRKMRKLRQIRRTKIKKMKPHNNNTKTKYQINKAIAKLIQKKITKRSNKVKKIF